MGDARNAALRALEKCRRAEAWSDAVLGSVMDRAGLEPRDRGLATALCYGVLQNRLLLDHVIGQLSTVTLPRIEPKVLDILRLSLYQILMLDRIPAAAAVNEGVRLCRESGCARAAGYVNAVLRRAAAGEYTLPEGTDPQSLSLRYSHPRWLTEAFLARLGPAETEALLRCDNSEAPMTLQVNTLRCDAETLQAELTDLGLDARPHPFLPDCLLLRHSGALTALAPFRAGHFFVQDAAANLALRAAGMRPGWSTLDVCAAPGGKSFAAAILGGNGPVLSCDLQEKKLKRISEGAQRLGLTGLSVQAMDARSFCPELEGRFDLVIADVPCSGLGVIRKKPDIRYKDPAAFAGLPAIQKAILRNVCRYVAPGGVLLYSTCTVRREENEAAVADFLAEQPGFCPEDFLLPGGLHSENGMLQLWPQRHGTDGFFIAKLRKQK